MMANAILAVMEQQEGKWNRMSWEALAAAQQVGAAVNAPVEAVVMGAGVRPLAEEAAQARLAQVHLLEHPLLERYTPDGYCAALRQLLAAVQPQYVLLPHTYQVRDFAPKLAVSLQRSLLSDCIGWRAEQAGLVFTRQLFQGKFNADISFEGPAPHFVSVQAGSFPAEKLLRGDAPAPVVPFAAQLEAAQIRTRPGEKFQESKRAVDLSQAEIIVAVGRGIKEQENLVVAEKLAQALGGEMGGSRPICDNGWLPMERQIGSSGQTVAPKLYIALGISGAIQHLVGMKGARTVVAINKDANAPIFEVADYGIVGNLFDIVPALTEEINNVKGQ
ncbi:MAG TPA: electron transfer flavoprotein subunit alpha/FixB family protein [Terriglobia bacterium]|nr:electron transfer flavoprotein subunit alpha/FixB family protein [Terriglobia bacterium]